MLVRAAEQEVDEEAHDANSRTHHATTAAAARTQAPASPEEWLLRSAAEQVGFATYSSEVYTNTCGSGRTDLRVSSSLCATHPSEFASEGEACGEEVGEEVEEEEEEAESYEWDREAEEGDALVVRERLTMMLEQCLVRRRIIQDQLCLLQRSQQQRHQQGRGGREEGEGDVHDDSRLAGGEEEEAVVRGVRMRRQGTREAQCLYEQLHDIEADVEGLQLRLRVLDTHTRHARAARKPRRGGAAGPITSLCHSDANLSHTFIDHDSFLCLGLTQHTHTHVEGHAEADSEACEWAMVDSGAPQQVLTPDLTSEPCNGALTPDLSAQPQQPLAQPRTPDLTAASLTSQIKALLRVQSEPRQQSRAQMPHDACCANSMPAPHDSQAQQPLDSHLQQPHDWLLELSPRGQASTGLARDIGAAAAGEVELAEREKVEEAELNPASGAEHAEVLTDQFDA
jgi:hypothetical protein